MRISPTPVALITEKSTCIAKVVPAGPVAGETALPSTEPAASSRPIAGRATARGSVTGAAEAAADGGIDRGESVGRRRIARACVHTRRARLNLLAEVDRVEVRLVERLDEGLEADRAAEDVAAGAADGRPVMLGTLVSGLGRDDAGTRAS